MDKNIKLLRCSIIIDSEDSDKCSENCPHAVEEYNGRYCYAFESPIWKNMQRCSNCINSQKDR